jgi:hypothetical protein
MPCKVEYDAEGGFMRGSAEGALDVQAIDAFVHEIVAALKEHRCYLLLNDFRNVTLAISTLEIYHLPARVAELLAAEGLNVYNLKRALVAASDMDDYRFFENVSVNHMQKVKVFRDIDQARAWLLEK